MYRMHTRIVKTTEPTIMARREVVATDVAVAGTHEPFVQGMTLRAQGGELTVVGCDPGVPQVALALALGGRVDLLSGSVTVGGDSGRAHLQRITRLVDVPDVTAPEEALPVAAVVAEELALAERPSGRRHVAALLGARGLADRARDRWDSLPAATRTALLLELGARHPHVRVVVLCGPDRHGGGVDGWLRPARSLADAGLTVIVLCSPATATAVVVAPSVVATPSVRHSTSTLPGATA
jgi:hypothetical protein